MQPERNDREKIVNFTAFFALATIALLIIVKKLFGEGGTLTNVLETIQNILILLTFGVASFNFVKDKKKGWKWAYAIILAVFVFSIVFIWIKK